MLEAVDELPLVDFSVSPVVDPNAFRLAINVLSLVARAIGVDLNALAIADVVLPLALVEPPVVVEHDALAKPFVVDDFPKVNAFLETLELGLLRMKESAHDNVIVQRLIVLDVRDDLARVFSLEIKQPMQEIIHVFLEFRC